MPATVNGRRLTVSVPPGRSFSSRARRSPTRIRRPPRFAEPSPTTSRCATKPLGSAPKTIAAGSWRTPSTTSSSGVAFDTSGRRSSRCASEVGSTDAVGSSTPDWNRPRSASPRWTRPAAVRCNPAPTDSSATMVATPSAMPTAVATVRALRRARLVKTRPSTALHQRYRAAHVTPETHHFADDGAIPNSPLPVLVYHGVDEVAAGAASCEQLFHGNGWGNSWRSGIFDFHHFHSTAHEVLGVAAGATAVVLGGPKVGGTFAVSAGDVLVLPAGTGHCRVGRLD